MERKRHPVGIREAIQASEVLCLLAAKLLALVAVHQIGMRILPLSIQTMSPVPVQAWDAKAHEEGESRVIHLDLSKDLGKL